MSQSTPVNPHAAQPISLFSIARSLKRNRNLILQMTKREVVGRYSGSFMGMAWSFFNPVFMLTVYTFVFSMAFKARWGTSGDESRTQFALVLFVGLVVHGLLAEVLNRAPSIIVSNVNFVTKVVFPVEILPVVNVCAALFHAIISLIVLLAGYLLFNGYLHWTAIFFPIVLMPLILLAVGLCWILSSLGVFLRDVSQTIGVITMAMMFLAPVFYPITALPPEIQPWIFLNPTTFIIEQARDVLIWGKLPNWMGIFVYTIISAAIAWAGFAWFQKTRKGFADVL